MVNVKRIAALWTSCTTLILATSANVATFGTKINTHGNDDENEHSPEYGDSDVMERQGALTGGVVVVIAVLTLPVLYSRAMIVLNQPEFVNG